MTKPYTSPTRGDHPFAAHTWFSALEAVAQDRGGEVGFVAEGPGWTAQLTFDAWRRVSRAVASSLASLEVGHGDRVAVAAPGGPIWPVLQTACSQLGAVLVPLNIRYGHDELSYALAVARARVIFALEALRDNWIADRVERALAGGDTGHSSPTLVTFARSDVSFAPEETQVGSPSARYGWAEFLRLAQTAVNPEPSGRAEDPVLLQFTSGTTAFPKAVLLSNAATLGVAFHLGERMGLTAGDVLFGTQPPYHVGGSVGTNLLPLAIGCRVVAPERYRPEEAFRLIPEHGCTARTGQGAMYAMEFAHPDYAPSHYRSVSKGWAAGSPELIRRIATEMGVEHVVAIYGLTESCSTATAASWRDDLEARAGSCGWPLPGLEVGVAVGSTVLTEADRVGEICVRGWARMLGYDQDPEATAETIDADGWLHTGDLGRLDAAGRLHFVDRAKDMIKPGGENVSAAEVERVIAAFPGVERAAVVGRPDARLGEVPVAFVEAAHDGSGDRGTFDSAAVHEYCAQRIAGFKVPRDVFIVASLPMTESGKVRKDELRKQLAASTPAGQQASSVGSSG